MNNFYVHALPARKIRELLRTYLYITITDKKYFVINFYLGLDNLLYKTMKRRAKRANFLDSITPLYCRV